MLADLTTLDALKPDPANRRKHNARNLDMIATALKDVGAARSIVIDEDNVILAGNGVTAAAAAAAGISKLRVVDAAGDELIAVRRSGLTAQQQQKRALALYDNRTAELAEWSVAQLQADLTNGEDLTAFFLPAELKALFGVKPGETDPDATPPPRPTGIVVGDLFELGTHRLLCGDSTTSGDVARLMGNVVPFLMVTDPPYGVAYDPKWRLESGINKSHQKRAEGVVANDDRADWLPAWQLFPGDVAYVWHGGLHATVVSTGLLAAGFDVRSQIIWAKPSLVIGRGHYHWQHEPCWYAVRKSAAAKWAGDRKQATVWAIANMHRTQGNVDDGKTDHGTQKPVECMLRPIRNHGGPDDHVYDPFVGSGTTLIAAEQAERRCFAMELTPAYVQMAIDRWEAFTGSTAVKVGEAVRS
jgi:DNA modification methylase